MDRRTMTTTPTDDGHACASMGEDARSAVSTRTRTDDRHHRRPLALLALSAALSVAAVAAVTAGSAFLSLASTPSIPRGAAPTLASTAIADPNHGIALVATWTTVAVLVGGYVVACFTGTLFSAALVAAVDEHRRQGPGSGVDGLRIAMLHFPQLLLWSLIAGTVGVVARQFGHRGVLGAALGRPTRRDWNDATAIVLPLIVNEDLGPLAAWKRSRQLAPPAAHDPRSTGSLAAAAAPATIVLALVISALLWPLAPVAAAVTTGTALMLAYVGRATRTGVTRSHRYHDAVVSEAGLLPAVAA
jgi:hypothetical protein